MPEEMDIQSSYVYEPPLPRGLSIEDKQYKDEVIEQMGSEIPGPPKVSVIDIEFMKRLRKESSNGQVFSRQDSKLSKGSWGAQMKNSSKVVGKRRALAMQQMEELHGKRTWLNKLGSRIKGLWYKMTGKNKSKDNNNSDSDELSESGEIDKKYIDINLKNLKYKVLHKRKYESESLIDVLQDTYDEQARRRIKLEEEQFRKANFRMVYKLRKEDLLLGSTTRYGSNRKSSFPMPTFLQSDMNSGLNMSLNSNLSRVSYGMPFFRTKKSYDPRKTTMTGLEIMSEKSGIYPGDESRVALSSATLAKKKKKKKVEKDKKDEVFDMTYQNVHNLLNERYENEEEFHALKEEAEFNNPIDYVNIKVLVKLFS